MLERNRRIEKQVSQLTNTTAGDKCQATNLSPQANSFFPTSITTLSRVSPCALWIVTVHASSLVAVVIVNNWNLMQTRCGR